MKRLPFPVKVDGIHLALRLEDSALTNGDQIVRMTIPAGGYSKLPLARFICLKGRLGLLENIRPILKVTG
jgi:hypothetical protein